MARRPKQRSRKQVAIDDRLVGLFRDAVAAREAMRKDPHMGGDQVAPLSETIWRFHKHIGHMPWSGVRNDPLHPHAEGEGGELRAALLAEIKRQDEAAKA